MSKRVSKCRASSLLYTIVIAFIVFIVLLSFIQISKVSNHYINREILKNKINSNINSALNILEKRKSTLFNDKIDIYNDGRGIVSLKSKFHGAFLIVEFNSIMSDMELTRRYLFGMESKYDEYALILPDKNNEITFSGKTKVTGDCLLPKLGVKQGNVNGTSFIGDKLVYGKIFKNKIGVPENNNKLEEIFNALSNQDYIKNYSEFKNEQKISNSFKEKLLVLYSDDKIFVENKTISGNVVLLSVKAVHIDKNSVLSDIIACAPYVFVDKGFNGAIQIFAKDSVRVEENVNLAYPSFIGVFSKNMENKGKIEINSNCLIAGSVLGLKKTHIRIMRNVKIFGTVYNQGSTEIKGSVYGTLVSDRLSITTKYNTISDVIQNADIDNLNRIKLQGNASIYDDYQGLIHIKELK